MGQDIGTYGGAFKVTEGLLTDFGRPRVINTPLAESACTGYAIGLALNGHRPIEEFQFADFSTEAVTQITLNAATMHFRSGAACPLVLRLPCGGGLTFGSFHSQELESLFLSMPGIKALYPSTPQDAFNAVLAAYEDDNPVLLFEHKALYRRGKGQVTWDPNYRDIWKPRRLREGDFATMITYGEMTHIAAEALFALTGAKVISVPFNGGQAVVNLLGERIEAIVQFPAAVSPHVKSGDLRVIAMLGSIRDPIFPDVPTAKEQGFDVALDMWRGIAVPRGTPKPVIARLQESIQKTVQSSEFQAAGRNIGFTAAYLPAEEFGKVIASDDMRLAQVMAQIGMKKQ